MTNTEWLFALFYLVPAGAVLLVFWAMWRLIRLLDLPLAVRRTLFVFIGTLGLAPMLVPAGTIMSAWVPHGLLLTAPDLGYYVRLARFVLPSFAVTATALGLIAWWRIGKDATPLRVDWTTFVIPVAVCGIVIGIYRYFVPDRDISPSLTTAAIERDYGEQLDDVVGLLSIEDDDERSSEAARLQNLFASDPAVLRVTLDQPGAGRTTVGGAFYHLNAERPPSTSCSGVRRPGQQGLIRCTWSYDSLKRRDVLRYTRSLVYGEETIGLVIEFDHDAVLDAVAER